MRIYTKLVFCTGIITSLFFFFNIIPLFCNVFVALMKNQCLNISKKKTTFCPNFSATGALYPAAQCWSRTFHHKNVVLGEQTDENHQGPNPGNWGDVAILKNSSFLKKLRSLVPCAHVFFGVCLQIVIILTCATLNLLLAAVTLSALLTPQTLVLTTGTS